MNLINQLLQRLCFKELRVCNYFFGCFYKGLAINKTENI